jgi:two-component system, cell cycle sensor histidine kinase and response regulator CckA
MNAEEEHGQRPEGDLTRRLRAQDERFRRVIENTEAGYFLIGMDGRYQDVNAAWLRMHGFTRREDAIGLHFSAVQTPQDLTQAGRIVEALMRGKLITGEFSRLRRDGAIGYHSFSANPVLDGARVIGLEGFLIDVTERKLAEEALRKSEENFATLFRCSPASITVSDLNDGDRFLEVNDAFEKFTGHRREAVIGRTYPPEWLWVDPLEYAEAVSQFTQSGKLSEFEFRFRRKSGEIRTGILSADSIEFDRRPCVVATTIDITERNRAQEALRENEQRLNSIYNTVSDSIFQVAVEPEGQFRFVSVNAAFLRVTGLSLEAVVGKTVNEVIPEPSLTMVLGRYQQAVQEKAVMSWEETSDYPAGRLIGEVSVAPVLDDKGRCTHLVGSVHNITERKRAEEEANRLQLQLAQAQKMESIGRLAGGVAHDFSNLMSVIMLHGESALEESRSGDSFIESVRVMQKAAQRAVALTRQLMAFSHEQVLETEVLNFNSVVAECVTMLRRLIGEDIELVLIPGSGVGLVKADPGQIGQLIMNLAVNSRDAMPQGGKLTIETARAEVDEADARLIPEAKPGSYVMLAVRDTGVGMDKETQARIFEPFFTTKEVGKGTGLGLSMVYGIVKQSNGYITVHSEPGHGSEVGIYLPGMLETQEPVLATEAASEQRGVETILVAEDEPALRQKVCEILENAGYQVLAGKDVDEVVQIAMHHKGPLDLLLTDVVMPDLSGPQLAQHLQTHYPQMKVLYMSGYLSPRQGNAALPSDAEFLQKPFTKQKLLHRLREVIEG